MKKLHLHLSALDVESFEVAPANAPLASGTVRGHDISVHCDATFTACDTGYTACGCDGTRGVSTCDGPSCNPTCAGWTCEFDTCAAVCTATAVAECETGYSCGAC